MHLQRHINYLGGGLTNLILSFGRKKLSFLFLEWAHLWHPYIEKCPRDEVTLIQTLLARAEGRIALTGTGVLQCYTGDTVYSVPCGRLSAASWKTNYKNWLFAKTLENSKRIFFEYNLSSNKLAGVTYYLCEKLSPVGGSVLPYVLSELEGEWSSDQFSHMSFTRSYSLLASYSGLSKQQQKSFIVNPEPGLTGYMHGDLHDGNILTTTRGSVALIDLDRFNFCGAQSMDVIHSQICKEENRIKSSWLEFYPRILCGGELFEKFSRNTLVAYFLFRLESEVFSDMVPQHIYVARLRSCCSEISLIMEESNDCVKGL